MDFTAVVLAIVAGVVVAAVRLTGSGVTRAVRARMLKRRVAGIEQGVRDLVAAVAREPVSVVHYGAFDIDPRHLVFWACVKTDGERDRLRSDALLRERMRTLLADHRYPEPSRKHVRMNFESQETVDRESGGDWWAHWK